MKYRMTIIHSTVVYILAMYSVNSKACNRATAPVAMSAIDRAMYTKGTTPPRLPAGSRVNVYMQGFSFVSEHTRTQLQETCC